MSVPKYITLNDAKYQCGIPLADTYHDDRLNLYIEAASEAVKNHLKGLSVYQRELNDDDEPVELDSNWEPLLNSFDSTTTTERVRPTVKIAVAMLVAFWFKESEGLMHPSDMSFPPAIQAVLNPLRDPQLK